MTTLKIVPNDTVVPKDEQILGLVTRTTDGTICTSEAVWNGLSETKELSFSFGGMIPSPVRIGTESDSGVLLIFESDRDRNIFLAELTKRGIEV